MIVPVGRYSGAMATDATRRAPLRSLAALLFLLLVLFAAPQSSSSASRPVAGASPAAVAAAEPTDTSTPESTGVQPVPADRTTVLIAQFTAGVRGSRAPPAASA